jgi:hypothetical protein
MSPRTEPSDQAFTYFYNGMFHEVVEEDIVLSVAMAYLCTLRRAASIGPQI